MTAVLQVGSQLISAEDMLPLLQRYQVLPQVLRGLLIDQAIAGLSCTEEEEQQAIAIFDQHNQLASVEARQAWLHRHGMTLAQYAELATRPLLIEKFKQSKWAHTVESYFLKRKRDLDQVIYSLIRTKDIALANELYFRILEGEQEFETLAEQYSQGLEARTGGLLGPVPVYQIHPAIAKLLMVSKPGKLWSPCVVGEWVVIVRLEKLIPAQLDEVMHRRMVDELFESWVQEQIQPPISES
ncbi:parvulin-like peptidyl-prolyl isomerase [Leptolyngbyaceae cyanobacterium JSC-12]|nr:parvulin-like peptidyl-prolyl isomerase [Leptolyngbyaceae cyanobacterium JSC-12]